MMALALALASFGIFAVMLSAILAISERRERQQVDRLGASLDRLARRRRTPAQRRRAAARRRWIESEKRKIHGLFDSDGT
jgi:hypothetical protein